MVEVPAGFQPAGRAPAPPPLDLVQDFVNTEIAVWAVDDIATPGSACRVASVARGFSPTTRGVDASSFVRARALRGVLRELARRNTHGVLPEVGLRAEFAAIAAESRLRFELGERGERATRARRRRGERCARRASVARLRGAGVGGLEAAQVLPGPHCGWLFFDGVAQRVVEVVLDVDLRESDEDSCIPASEGRIREVRVVRRHARLEAASSPRQRRARHRAGARGCDCGARRRPRGGDDRDGPLRPRRQSSGSRRPNARCARSGSGSPAIRASGCGPRRCRGRRLRRTRPRRPDAADPLP